MKRIFLFVITLLMIIACLSIGSVENDQSIIDRTISNASLSSKEECDIDLDLLNINSEAIVDSDTYLKNYYYGLTSNIGDNYMGSCGYVALGMLLSYYDSYLDDNIIPEQYDVASNNENSDFVTLRNSPGIKLDDDLRKTIDKDNKADYYYEMEELKDSSLHAKLITIGAKLGYVEKINSSGIHYEYGTYLSDRVEILKQYLEEFYITNYKIETRDINYTTQSVIRQFIVEQVQAGYPVLVGNNSHAFIVYDYSNNTLYGHLGYVGKQFVHCDYEKQGFNKYTAAMVLKFPTKEHTHSYNYEVQHGDHVDKYCYCDEFIRTDSNAQLNNPVKRKCDILEGTYTIPSWATYINSDVYQNNEQIKNLNFESDSKLEYIPNNAFKGCKNLRSVSFSTGIDYIGERAFEDCTSLYYIDFGNSLIKEVGYGAFNNCTALKYSKYTEFGVHLSTDIFYIPKSFTYIGELAFSNCKNIGEIIVKGNINKICFATFGDCTSLKNITFSSKVQTIESYAFRGCSSLKNATFSSGLSEIYDYVFSNTGLTHFEIPDGVTYIGDEVFYGCKYLTSVLLPSSVTYIGSDALSGGDETTSGQVTIYTERSAPYNGWSNNWNGGRPVFFGCTLSEDKTYVETINTALLKNKDAENGINPPYRKRYKFDGWYLNSSFTGTKYDVNSAITANPGVLYTKWKIDLTQGI